MPPRNELNNASSLPRAQGAQATYSVIPTDSIQDVAEALGLPQLHPSVASALAADVEYRVRQLVQDSSKFMRHANRQQLRVSDIDRALRLRNIEPIFGFHPTTLGKASVSGAYPTPVGTTFRRIRTQTGPIHLVNDEEIDLEKVLETGPKVALSPGVGWAAHWLAIEGVQPAVPQNPAHVAATNAAAGLKASTAAASSSTTMVQPSGASAFLSAAPSALGGGAKAGQAVAKPLIKHVLSRELQLYFERLTSAIIDPPTEANVPAGSSKNGGKSSTDVDGDVSMGISPKAVDPTESAAATAKTDEARSSGNTVRDAALASLRGDPGLHQLVPYLIQWINEKIQSGLRDETVLDLMLHTIDALVTNPYLGIEPYMHQLLPCVLSILLTASLGHSPSSPKAYVLRVQAAFVLSRIVRQYSSTYPTLLPRIVRSIVGALDAGCAKAARRLGASEATDEGDQDSADDSGPRESASTKLGALIGLRHLGLGPLRSILVNDSQGQQIDCILRRLGFWCTEAEGMAGRRDEIAAIVDEVKVSFAEIASSIRGNISIPDPTEGLRRDDVQPYIGEYWARHLSEDTDAARGLLAILSEVQRQRTSDEAHG